MTDPRPASEMQLRPEIREALGLSGVVPGGRRNDLLRSLGPDLSQDECEVLMRELVDRPAASVPSGWFTEYFHEVATVLQEQKDAGPEFVRVLATVARDARRDVVVRDYAIQHLRQAWNRAGAELRPAVEATFREFAASGDSVIAGPALLSLHVLGTPDNGRTIARQASLVPPSPGEAATGNPQVPDGELEPLVGNILKRPPTPDGIVERLTAIRISADRRLVSRRGDLRRIAADDNSEHAVVRMAAISALSRLADPSDGQFLESLESDDPRIAGALRHAKANLQ